MHSLNTFRVTIRFHEIRLRGFFSVKTPGFSLHILALAPSLAKDNIVRSTYTFSAYRNKFVLILRIPKAGTIPVCTLEVAICARMSRSGKRLDN